jgi:hypothetical protein
MNDRDRLEQIRALRDRVERLPASPQRNWMLSEVGARAVDIESGTPTAPIRPLASEAGTPSPQPPRAARARLSVAAAVAASAAPRPNATPRPPAHAEPERHRVLLEEGLRLCLDDDASVVAIDIGDHRLTSPWARGLRG